MSATTSDELLHWVEGVQVAEGETQRRLLAYRSGPVFDSTVPDGWVRLFILPIPSA
jgi:hypothetical protein